MMAEKCIYLTPAKDIQADSSPLLWEESQLLAPTQGVSYTPLPLPSTEAQVYVPHYTADELQLKLERLRKYQKEVLSSISIQRMVDEVDQAVTVWVDPQSKWRQAAARWLPELTGYDSHMLDSYLTRFFKGFRKEKLLRFLQQDFPNPTVLDEFHPRPTGGMTKAYGPEVITHVFSGNIPGLPIWSIVCGWLVKSTSLGKTSSVEPFLPYLFARSLRETSPLLAPSLDIVSWKSGNAELEAIAYTHAGAVVAYGSDRSIEAIRSYVPGHIPLISHGHKVSFGVVGREALDPHRVWDTAHEAAKDISWFDQQGCVAPHTLYVERGGELTPNAFAAILARELENYEHRWPSSPLSIEESASLQQRRTAYEMKMGLDPSIQIHTGHAAKGWTVVCQSEEPFGVSPLHRFIYVIPVDDIYRIPDQLQSVRKYVQSVGVAVSPLRLRGLTEALGKAGASRICRLGSMAFPDPGWHHDGGWNLLSLVRWTDVESGTEEAMDAYDPYRV
jgi:hypothetical protein